MSEPETLSERLDSFIPFTRRDLVDLCVSEGKLGPDQATEFRELCEILSAWVHFRFQDTTEELKKNLAPFDPDREIPPLPQEQAPNEESAQRVVSLFEQIARRANYFEITREEIQKCFEAVTLIDLHTRVELEDFKEVRCFARGDIFKTATVRKLFRRKEVRVDVLERVMLLLHYQDEAYFQQKDRKKDTTDKPFQPGKIYAYLYKDVPKFDLELLFPNVQVGMNWKDRILFGIPAIGGSIGVLIKAAPQFLIILGVVLFFTAGPDWSARVGVSEESATNFMPVLTALLGVVIALGGLAFKQWSNYRKKRIEFLKDVSEQLFFRNLANNRSVFHRVIDSAEDEENKEMILVLYHLITNPEESMTSRQLDARIESWMKEKFGTVIDFDIHSPLEQLHKLRGPDCEGREVSMVETDSDGHLKALSPGEGRKLVDHLWDRAFRFG